MFGQDRKRKRSTCYLELFNAGLSGGRTLRWGRKTPTTTCKCFQCKGVAMGLTEAPHQRCRASCLSFQMDPARPPPNLPTSSHSLRGDCWSLHLLSLVWLQAWSPTPQASLPWGLIDCKPTIRRPGRASLLLTSSTHFIPLLGSLHSASHPLPSLLTGK